LGEPQNQGGERFSVLVLKIDSCGLVIWTIKSPRRFFDFGLKTKQAMVHWLRHKTDGRASAWDTRRDLLTCFTWKQVGLGFPSLASRLVEVRRWVVYVAPSLRLRQSQLEDGRVDATDYVGPCYPCCTIFVLVGPRGIVFI
jgi:hypothetical protein